MTRKRTIDHRIEELEAASDTGDVAPIKLSETDKEHLDTMVSDALDVLTDEECARLDELAEQIEVDGVSDSDWSAGDPPSAAETEFLDLLFHVASRRQLEGGAIDR